MPKRVSIWSASIIAMTALTAAGPDERVPTHEATEIETLVGDAAEALESHGSEAFAAFRRKNGPWRYGDVYLFVIDMRGLVLFNAGQPAREGTDMLREHDANGKQFHKDFIETVTQFGSGWVDYMFPRPHRTVPEIKWSYVCGTHVDGVGAIVGAGVYVK